ncbi:hypothetical protein EVAR_10224_1 [Eumeta japonica]|uniref:Uncharacterized protein n=1 Tax=Eumeta variegata TaxID=151549 RepID=A0A4C1TEN9_EUMVA|nr:hypothetical protein EVAR_10224_1 [Eumeta japonica]
MIHEAILKGKFKDEVVLIPRIPVIPKDMPFELTLNHLTSVTVTPFDIFFQIFPLLRVPQACDSVYFFPSLSSLRSAPDQATRAGSEKIQVPDATLTYAAQMSLRAAGKSDASAIIKEITKSPTRAYKIRKVITQNKEKIYSGYQQWKPYQYPLLSCTRSRFMKNKKPFTKEALEFLIPESDDSEDTGAQYTTTIDECDISDDNEFD